MSKTRIFVDMPIERKLLLVSAVPILALLLLSLVTYKSVQTFSHAEDHLNQVYHIQSASAEYMRLAVDLETGFRGFVLTQQSKFLKPYEAAKARVVLVGRSLEQMVEKNQEQYRLIENSQEFVQQLMADKDRLIEQVKKGHPEEALEYIESGKGRSLMLGIREGMALFDRREVELLRQALASSTEDRWLLLAVIVGGGTLALVFMVVPLHLIARSITRPLVELSRRMGSASGGSVPDVPVLNRADEIGDLSRVIRAMSNQLRDHITRLQQSEFELRLLNTSLAASEAKYRGIVDHAPIGIFTIQDNRFIFSNSQNWIIAGRESDVELDPELLWDAVHPEDRETVHQALTTATAQGTTFEKVFRFLHPNGAVRKVLSRAIPIHNEEGGPDVYQGFNVDITAFEHMRDQLNRAERLATLGQVAAGIAHEIRNPLVGIGSTTSLLLEDFSEQDARRHDLTTVLRETKRLDRIVNQIVEYAKPRELALVSFSVEDVVGETLELLSESVKGKRIVVDWPKSERSHVLQADRDQFKQVLLNTIQNAIESMDVEGQLHVTIHDRVRQQENGLAIDITDNGKGIVAGDLSRIFAPFFTSGKRRGTGLGLAICRNIVDAHGGDIQVKSQPGSGTTMSIWFPSFNNLNGNRPN